MVKRYRSRRKPKTLVIADLNKSLSKDYTKDLYTRTYPGGPGRIPMKV